MMIVNTKIQIIEKQDTTVPEVDGYITIANVWNKDRIVGIVIDGKTIVVHADELRKAIDNATKNEIR